MTEPAAGWYHDPSDSGAWRWWDGTSWTDHIRAKEETPVSAPITVVPESTISGPLPVQPASGPVTIQADPAPAPVVQPVPTHAPNFDDFPPAPSAAPVAAEPEPELEPEPAAVVEPEPAAHAGPEPVAVIPQPGEVAAGPTARPTTPNYAATPVTDQMYWHSSAAEVIEVPRLTTSTTARRAGQRGPVPSYVRDWNDLGSPNTPGIWLLALSPILGSGLFFLVATAMTMASLPPIVPLIAGIAAAQLLNWVFAGLDTRSLAARGYHAPRLAWMLLFPPLAYFIARGKSVRRESKAAWGPELAYIASGAVVVGAYFVLLTAVSALYAPLLASVR